MVKKVDTEKRSPTDAHPAGGKTGAGVPAPQAAPGSSNVGVPSSGAVVEAASAPQNSVQTGSSASDDVLFFSQDEKKASQYAKEAFDFFRRGIPRYADAWLGAVVGHLLQSLKAMYRQLSSAPLVEQPATDVRPQEGVGVQASTGAAVPSPTNLPIVDSVPSYYVAPPEHPPARTSTSAAQLPVTSPPAVLPASNAVPLPAVAQTPVVTQSPPLGGHVAVSNLPTSPSHNGTFPSERAATAGVASGFMIQPPVGPSQNSMSVQSPAMSQTRGMGH